MASYKSVFACYNCPDWPGGEVETLGSAKPPCGGSIPPQASMDMPHPLILFRNIFGTISFLAFILAKLNPQYEYPGITAIFVSGGIAVTLNGIYGLVNKEILIKHKSTSFTKFGNSAQLWGLLYIIFGLSIIIIPQLSRMDYFYTGKLDFERLIRPHREVIVLPK